MSEQPHAGSRASNLSGRGGAHDGPRRRPPIGKIGRGDPTMRCGDAPAPALLRGIAEFNRGEFFEQHETLEDAWIDETDPIRYLYQGILQVGVGFYHLSRGNAYGARRLWMRGVALLETFPSRCCGVDVAALIASTRRCMAELDRLGDARIAEFDRALIPHISVDQPPAPPA